MHFRHLFIHLARWGFVFLFLVGCFFFFQPSSAVVEAFTDITDHRLEVELLQNTSGAWLGSQLNSGANTMRMFALLYHSCF